MHDQEFSCLSVKMEGAFLGILSFIILIFVIASQIVIGLIFWIKIKKLEEQGNMKLKVKRLQILADQHAIDLQNIMSVVNVNEAQIASHAIKLVNMTLVDLAEFKALDPYLKDAYKKYFVNLAMLQIMNKINTFGKENNLAENLKTNDVMIQKIIIDALSQLDRTEPPPIPITKDEPFIISSTSPPQNYTLTPGVTLSTKSA